MLYLILFGLKPMLFPPSLICIELLLAMLALRLFVLSIRATALCRAFWKLPMLPFDRLLILL
jgi:hypothetical protein